MNNTVLYVEDDPAYIELFIKILKDSNLIIHTAKNGTEGGDMYEKLTPPLVFLDIHLPGIPGYVVLRRIKKFATDNHLSVKIVMLTSQNSKDDVKKAISYGADDYMVKPYTKQILFAKIKLHLPGFALPENQEENGVHTFF